LASLLLIALSIAKQPRDQGQELLLPANPKLSLAKTKKLHTKQIERKHMKKVNLDRGQTYPFPLVTARASEFILLFPVARVNRAGK
jgi:hypothetical protein